jgi:AraC-like DNA-binding protein
MVQSMSMLRHWQTAAAQHTRSDSLELARHWLTAGDQPIERIAERLGYRQPSNFIRAFRKQFGITPKQFRLCDVSGRPVGRLRRNAARTKLAP